MESSIISTRVAPVSKFRLPSTSAQRSCCPPPRACNAGREAQRHDGRVRSQPARCSGGVFRWTERGSSEPKRLKEVRAGSFFLPRMA